ncbi:MAG: hypothetical protein ABFD77_08915 [Thermotogota bacterium]
MDGGTLRGLVCMIIGAAIVASASPSLAAGAAEWTVQTSSDIVLFVQGDVDASVPLALIEQSLSEIVAYWGIDANVVRNARGSASPLCSVSLYSDWELMAREFGRFDISGMARACGVNPKAPTGAPAPGPCAVSPFAVIASGYPTGDWLAIVAHEVAHVLQWRTWHFGLNLTWMEDDLFREGMAEWTRYALGSGDFGADSQSLVSFWLRAGGTLDAVPFYLEYDVGASLVERCVRLGGPQKLWAICSETTAIPIGDTGVNWYKPIDFARSFSEAYGIDWDSYLADWATEARLTDVPRGTEIRDRYMRDAFNLRGELLRPLLSGESCAALEEIKQAVVDRTATSADLDYAETLLRGAPEVDVEIDVEALSAREETLKGYALQVDGSRDDVVNVLRLGMLARRGEADAQEYAAAFAEAVNSYVSAAVSLPSGF